MPKIQLFSDIHSRWKDVSFDNDASVILAVGDMTEGVAGVEWLKKSGKRVLYVPGNHEFYEGDLEERLDELIIAAKGSNVTILDQRTVVIDGVRFIGATLWSDFANMDPIIMRKCQKTMNDYRMISVRGWFERERNRREYSEILTELTDSDPDGFSGYPKKPEKFNPIVAMVMHKRHLSFISKELENKWDGRTVVVTHHAPSIHSLTYGGYFVGHDVRNTGRLIPFENKPHKIGAYASSLDYFFANHSISFWAHGHIHKQLKYRINSANILANPAGYHQTENQGFVQNLTFDPDDETFAKSVMLSTLERNLSFQAEFSGVLRKSIVSDKTLPASEVLLGGSDVSAFARAYNQVIAILLAQSKKDCQRADFIADPINTYKIQDIVAAADPGNWSSTLARCIKEMLSTIQSNESRTSKWIASLKGP